MAAAPINASTVVLDIIVVTITETVTVINPPPTSASAPSPVSTPVIMPSDDGSFLSGNKTILSVVNKYRGKYSLPLLRWSDELQANAQKTTNDNHGATQNHELNKGSYAQCLSPGFSTPAQDMDLQGLTPFEMSYLSWMCERKSDQELQADNNDGIDVCSLITGPRSIMRMNLTEHSHYDILTNKDYNTIGCAFTANPYSTQEMWTGIWGCDLGF